MSGHHHHGHHHHGHHHHHGSGTRNLGIAIFLNLAITLAQLVAGVVSDSLSLLSDAVHNFSDVFALVLSLIAVIVTSKGFSQKQTFGYKRAEILAALLNGISLVVIAIFVCREAAMRFSSPHPVDAGIVMAFSGMGIVVNFASALMLRKDAKHSLNLRSAYLHLLFDTLASIGVFFGALIMEFTGAFWLDSVLSIVISVIIAYSTIDLLWATIKVLMQFSPDHIDLKKLESAVLKNHAIANIHHVHIWQLNDREIHLEAHLDFREDLLLSQISSHLDEIRHRLQHDFGISHAVFQSEYHPGHSIDLVPGTNCS